MTKEMAKQELRLLSSGTIANLTGLKDYDEQDAYMFMLHDLIDRTDVEMCHNWQEVWTVCMIALKAEDSGAPVNIIRTLLVEPEKQPVETFINATLTGMQELVQGYIEAVRISKETTLICNEEGKLIGLPPNRMLRDDIIAGTFFLVGAGGDGETISVCDEEIQRWMSFFSQQVIISSKSKTEGEGANA